LFTGLVSEIGTVKSTTKTAAHLRLVIRAPKTASETELGASININGACQTVSSLNGDEFSVDTIPETLKKTTLGDLKIGNLVNLEQALRASDRLGGHIVSGHIDCVGTVREIIKQSSKIEIRIAYPVEHRNLVAPQGSIAVNGISLTIAELSRDAFKAAIIPTTWEETTLAELRSGSNVNLEFDIIGKYVVRFLARNGSESKIDEQMLRELGY
jgi:riboflavin synthase